MKPLALANKKTPRFIDWYMARTVNFGGEIKTTAEVYEWFKANGYPQNAADLWLLGYFQTHNGASS